MSLQKVHNRGHQRCGHMERCWIICPLVSLLNCQHNDDRRSCSVSGLQRHHVKCLKTRGSTGRGSRPVRGGLSNQLVQTKYRILYIADVITQAAPRLYI